jgi:tRNA A-37 threonylcarbamoyl transferase component Bud32
MTIDWHMTDPLREVLLAPGGLRLDEWRRCGLVTVVKDSPHRAIYRVRLPDLDLHIKQYRPAGLRSRLRELLRPNKARREANLAASIRARGIPTPEPLAWGIEQNGFGRSAGWLITRTEPGVPLLSLTETEHAHTSPAIHRLADELGRFLARLHATGVNHEDLHPGNLLVNVSANCIQFSLLDLHAVQLGPPCTWPERRDNLIVFNRYFMLRASRSERQRFWQSYAAASGAAINLPVDQAGRQIERLTLDSNRRFWAARDRRCLVSNRYYRRAAGNAIRGIVVRDLKSETVESLCQDADAFFASGARVLKDGRSSTVIELPIEVGRQTIAAVLKRFRCVDGRDPWLALLRRTPVIRSWVNGHGLRERCLPTARPLAVMHRYRNGLPCEGYLLTEKIENAVELRAWADRLVTHPANEKRREIGVRIPALARLIRQLHTRGLAHRDLKAANILTSETLGDARFWFIDLVGVTRPGRVSARLRAQNLARLHASFVTHPLVTQTDKLRFLRAYLAWGLRGKCGWKRWWRRIESATRAKVARNRRSGRPLA